jgi:hypothetical protein
MIPVQDLAAVLLLMQRTGRLRCRPKLAAAAAAAVTMPNCHRSHRRVMVVMILWSRPPLTRSTCICVRFGGRGFPSRRCGHVANVPY